LRIAITVVTVSLWFSTISSLSLGEVCLPDELIVRKAQVANAAVGNGIGTVVSIALGEGPPPKTTSGTGMAHRCQSRGSQLQISDTPVRASPLIKKHSFPPLLCIVPARAADVYLTPFSADAADWT
jgi:hypothetical protein